ncbi:hypothetical protein [Aestuariivivens sediminis]|uniref:hypothetical protein n=1 Tax=Aestuariivivens sediminis TaxID=2913557 RepID=UPI001F586535|nr:hypothetical protein [Aestuariivivens sediminis]
MNLLKQLINFYINSSIHVALSVVSLTGITMLEYTMSIDYSILMFVFFSSIIGYNFVKYYGLAKLHHRSLVNWLNSIRVVSVFSFILMCYYALQLDAKALSLIGVLALFTFLYATPFLPERFIYDNRQNLRSISGLKIYIIALVWTGVTVFLPLIVVNFDINLDVLITAFQRFLYVIVLMLPFEIRDLRFDNLKLSTVPQKIGIKQTKYVGSVLLGVFLFLEIVVKNEFIRNDLMPFLIITLSTWLFLIFAKIDQGKYYSAFWVEGLPIFWFAILLIIH